MSKIKISLLSKFSIDENKKKKIKKLLPGSLATLLILAVVLFTVFHSTDGFTTIIDTEPANMVTERDYMSFTSYLLRNEKIITSEYSGGVYYLADDGERINPGDELARVYENKKDNSTAKLSDELGRCINILEESIGDGVFTLGESTEVKNRISKIYLDMMRAISNGNASVVSSDADELLVLLNKINMYSGNGDLLKATLEKYKTQKEKLENKFSGNFETITSSEGGYFFKQTDGYENIYSSADIEDLTYDSFFEMTSQSQSGTECVGKLLLDYRWYIVIPTVKGISDTFSVGNTYTVSFPDSYDRDFNMKLENILLDSTGARSLMVFSCGIVDGDFDYLRVQRINITHRNVSGFRIPESAVCEVNGNTGVYILKDGMASFRKIIILYEGDGYYIVSAENSNSNDYFIYLEQNDNIILNSKNMYEGKVIG